SRAGLGDRPRHPPRAAAAVQRDAARARRRATVHRAQHPDDTPGVRTRPDRGAELPGRRDSRRPCPRAERADDREHPALGPPPAPADLRAAPGDPDVLQVRGRRQRPVHDERRVQAAHALDPRALVRAPAIAHLDQRAPDVHPRVRRRRRTREPDHARGAARVPGERHPAAVDRGPSMVVTDDGRLVWMLDGYTTTTRYPYSDPVPGVGNYVRNSVKVTIDAYHGAVRYYLADLTDPIVRAYSRAFHGLFQPLDAMPADLRAHLRYPEDFFAIQARKYATYHMRDPQVFYNKEDLWTVPPRTIDGREREMEPYYTIMRLPGEKKEEFILLTLYNPSRRDNMIAWLA